MRSREFRWLMAKEFRELLASRSFWFLLAIAGPLVGQGFITAVNSYAEASGIGGGPAALAQGLSPLDGILTPTFGAYDLAVTLLFPFAAIRLIATEKESGALKLLLQTPPGLAAMLSAKGLVLLAGWAIVWIPGFIAVLLFQAYGGFLYAPELLNLLLGHLLRVILASGVAVFAASLTAGASSAAIVALAFTAGTWVLDFVAAGRGGWAQRIAGYTPTATLRSFEQGQLALNSVFVMLVLGVAGYLLAWIWLPTRYTLGERLMRTLGAAAVIGFVLCLAAAPRASWDLSENRRNSFPPAAERALRRIAQPLRVTVNLAPEDPRLADLERSILSKLKRILPRVDVGYAAQSRTGLFEKPGQHYGEIWYEWNGRRAMSRSATEAIVLETLYQLAGVPAPLYSEKQEFNGHPLAARPIAAGAIFYCIWPAAIVLAWCFFRTRRLH